MLFSSTGVANKESAFSSTGAVAKGELLFSSTVAAANGEGSATAISSIGDAAKGELLFSSTVAANNESAFSSTGFATNGELLSASVAASELNSDTGFGGELSASALGEFLFGEGEGLGDSDGCFSFSDAFEASEVVGPCIPCSAEGEADGDSLAALALGDATGVECLL